MLPDMVAGPDCTLNDTGKMLLAVGAVTEKAEVPKALVPIGAKGVID
jgi:hypothetical protein